MSASPLDHAPSTTHLSYEALTLLLQRIFTRQGTSESVAQVLRHV